MKVVQCLCHIAYLLSRNFRIVSRYEPHKTFSLIGNHYQIPTWQWKCGMGFGSSIIARKRWTQRQLPHNVRTRNILYIQNHQTIPTITAITQSVPDKWWSMQPAFGHKLRNMRIIWIIIMPSNKPVRKLMRHPPSANLFWLMRIADIHTPINQSFKSSAF